MSTLPEQIIAVVVARLERITEENDFDYDVVDVVRPNRLGTNASPKPRSFHVDYEESTRVPELDRPGNPPAICRELAITITAFGAHDDSATGSKRTDAGMMIADAVKAITNPATFPARWFTFDEIGFDAQFGDEMPMTSPAGHLAGASIPLTVRYRHDENDPYQSRA